MARFHCLKLRRSQPCRRRLGRHGCALVDRQRHSLRRCGVVSGVSRSKGNKQDLRSYLQNRSRGGRLDKCSPDRGTRVMLSAAQCHSIGDSPRCCPRNGRCGSIQSDGDETRCRCVISRIGWRECRRDCVTACDQHRTRCGRITQSLSHRRRGIQSGAAQRPSIHNRLWLPESNG
jgi:hypothetical protein